MTPEWYLIFWLYATGVGLAHMAYGSEKGKPDASVATRVGYSSARVLVVVGWPIFFLAVVLLGSLGIIKDN